MIDSIARAIWWCIVIMVVLLTVSWCTRAEAHEPCREFTDEQQWLLDAAYAMGEPHGWGYTLAAMTWQESFLGDRVYREKLDDGDYGSYGVTHVQLSTAIEILGWEHTDNNRANIKRILVECDTCAMDLSLAYVMGHIERLGWRDGIARYNGSGEGAERHSRRVVAKVRELERCMDWES